MVSSTIIRAVLISTVIITAMSMFLKASIPLALDASLSFPILWSSFFSCPKPPYIFVVVNVIIGIIIASSRYYRSIGDLDGQDESSLRGGYYKIQTEPIVNQAPPRRLEVKDVDLDFMVTIPSPILVAEVERSDVVYEEKSEEISGLINGGDEFVVLSPTEKPLVSALSGHRKLVKVTPKGNGKKALRVVKPKRHETFENTWKMTPEVGTSTPLTSHYQRPDTFGLGPGGDVKPALRISETCSDVTNIYHQSPTVMLPVKMKKLMSHEEQDLEFDEFIKKVKEEWKTEKRDRSRKDWTKRREA